MSEHDSPPSVVEQIRQLQDQMNALASRLASIEKRLPIEGFDLTPAPPSPGAAPAAPSPPPSAAPWLAQQHTAPPPADPAPSAIPQPGGTGADRPMGSRPDKERRAEVLFDLAASAEGEGGGAQTAEEPQRERARSAPMGTQQWETLIGGKWALWVGSVAVFIAMAFFLAYAWQYLGSAGRLAVGFAAGLAFLGAGRWARERVETWFGEGLTGGGLAILYLSIWAGAQRYGLLSFDLAFALMAVTTAVGVTLAVSYNAVSLSALAVLGGFLTPAMLHSSGSGSPQSVGFLTYIAVLNAGILAVSLFKRWHGIVWLSFAATILLMLGWAADSYTLSLRWVVFAFASLYFLLFLGAACFYSLIHKEATKQEDLLLLFADALTYAMAGYALLQGGLGDYPGSFPLALALGFALLSAATDALAPANPTLGPSATGLSLLFLTITVPIQLQQGWVTIGWSVEAAVLLTLGIRLRAHLLQRAGQFVWAFSLLSLLSVLALAEPVPHVLFLNARALPLLVSALASGWMAVVAGGIGAAKASSEAGQPPGQKDELSPAYAAAAVLGGAWLIAQETYLGFSWRLAPLPTDWQASALFTIAGLWAVYALAVFGLGLQLRHPGFRFSALMVASLATILPMGAGLSLPTTGWTPFWNPRWLSYVVVALTLGMLGWLMTRERDALEQSEGEVIGVVPVGISLVALCGMSLEIYSSFRWWTMPSQGSWNTAALFALATFWCISAIVLLELGLLWGQTRMRGLAYLVGAVAVVVLLFNSLDPSAENWSPILNLRFLAFVMATTMLGMTPLIIRRRQPGLGPVEAEMANGARWLLLPVAVALWGLTQETYETFRSLSGLFGEHWDRAAQMGISLVWTLCGVLMLIGGVVRQYQPIRLFALGLLGLTVTKVFLFDLGFLTTSYRILSFGGLGLALIGISWLYSRYGQLRA